MYIETGALIQHDNATLLDGLRGSMSSQYRAKVPKATQGNLSAAVREIQRYKPHMNELIDALVNRIGMEIFRRNSWKNPMAVFKRGLMEHGDTVEEVQMGTLEAHTYNPDRDSSMSDLFGTELPDIQSSFHKITRQEYYKVTITRVMLKRAFLNNNGLSELIESLIQSATTSDNRDEFLQMTELFKIYEASNGFYRINIPDVAAAASTEIEAKAAVRSLRETVGNLEFMNPKYNAAGMEVAVDTEDLVLFVTPAFRAAMDVNALAAMFNIEYGQTVKRIINIPAWRMPSDDVQALLTTSDFFIVMDTVFETSTVENGHKLSYNYFLHHHSIISCSRFVPAIAFTTGLGTIDNEETDVTTGVSTITLDEAAITAATEVTRGVKYQLAAHGTTALGAETAVRWQVEGNTSLMTHISSEGVLTVSGIEGGVVTGVAPDEVSTLTLKAITTEIDPANPWAEPFTATATVEVVGESLELWPVPTDDTP